MRISTRAVDLEGDQRFAQRGPRHVELLREVALGRQPARGAELAGADQGADLVGDLLVQPANFAAVRALPIPLRPYWPDRTLPG